MPPAEPQSPGSSKKYYLLEHFRNNTKVIYHFVHRRWEVPLKTLLFQFKIPAGSAHQVLKVFNVDLKLLRISMRPFCKRKGQGVSLEEVLGARRQVVVDVKDLT